MYSSSLLGVPLSLEVRQLHDNPDFTSFRSKKRGGTAADPFFIIHSSTKNAVWN